MNLPTLIPFLVYLVLLIIIVVYTSKSVDKSEAGFFLGGRKIDPFLVSISTVIAARGSWLLLGITAQAYIIGLSAIWLIAGFIISEFLLFLFLAPAINKQAEKNDCTSIADIIVSRFPEKGNSLRFVISLVLLFFLVSFISAQLIGVSKAFYSFLGLTLTNGIIITGLFILLLTFFGGSKTLKYADALHLIIILTILIGLPLIILFRAEGLENIKTEILYSNPDHFRINTLSAGVLLGFLSIGLGSAGNAHILFKYMSIKKGSNYQFPAIFSAILNILMATGALFIGILARYHFPSMESIPGVDAEYTFTGLSWNVFSPVLAGVAFTAILASAISASGSQILVSANTLVVDLFKKSRKRKKELSPKHLIFLSRVALVILAYISILTSMLIEASYYTFVLFSWAGLGASFGPAIILSFIWKGATSRGIIAGILSGAITVIVWHNTSFLSEAVYELFPGFIISLITIWIASRIDKIFTSWIYNRTQGYNKTAYPL
jgi:sodium/proline symporter